MAKDERRTILVTGSTGTVGSEVVKQLGIMVLLEQVFTQQIKLIN